MTDGYKVTTYTILAHQKLQKKLPTDWQEKDTNIDQARTSERAGQGLGDGPQAGTAGLPN